MPAKLVEKVSGLANKFLSLSLKWVWRSEFGRVWKLCWILGEEPSSEVAICTEPVAELNLKTLTSWKYGL